ncbi:MAG: hypothetical protein AB1792_04275 [Candidatus Zixiibacteriota bacterium]
MLGRRLLFAILALAVIGVLLARLHWTQRVSPETRQAFELIESLDSSAVVMVSFDHEAASLPEVGPLGEAIIRHCFRRGVRIIGLALFPEGTAAGYELLARGAGACHAHEGSDWLYLGYRPQYTAAILGMGEEIRDVFSADYAGRPLDATPLGQRIHNYRDVALIVSVADGSMATYWVEYAGVRYHARILAALSAVMVTSYIPYLEAGQLAGLVAGFRGAAEYEQLLSQPGAGSRGMAAQTVAHGLIVLLVIVGNLEAWRARRRRTTEATH